MTQNIDHIATELGQKFKAAREGLGHDYAAVAKDICVSKCYLKAIDEGQFDALPGRTFALGFVRSYAEALKMDGDEAVILYKKATTPEDAVEENAIVTAGGVPMTMNKMRGNKMHTSQEKSVAAAGTTITEPRGKLNYSVLFGFLTVVAILVTAGDFIPAGM